MDLWVSWNTKCMGLRLLYTYNKFILLETETAVRCYGDWGGGILIIWKITVSVNDQVDYNASHTVYNLSDGGHIH